MLSQPQTYQQQLDTLVLSVYSDEQHLFNDLEKDIVFRYQLLSSDAKEMLFRLLTRKHKHVRLDKTKWESISDKLKTALELENLKFINLKGPESLQEMLQLLNRPEIEVYCNQYGIKTAKRKVPELCLLLLEVNSNNSMEQISSDIGPIIFLENREFFEKLWLIYTRAKYYPSPSDWFLDSILTNLELGTRVYPDYKYYRVALTWPTLESFKDYFMAIKLEYELKVFLANKDQENAYRIYTNAKVKWDSLMKKDRETPDQPICHITGIHWLIIFTEAWVYTRIMHTCIDLLYSRALQSHREISGKLGKRKSKEAIFEEICQLLDALIAQKNYMNRKRGKWYDVFSKIADIYLKDRSKAKELCVAALDLDNEPFVQTGFRNSIEKRLCSIRNTKLKQEMPHFDIYACKATGKQGSKASWLNQDTNEHVNVEELAVQYYKKQGWNAIHSENSLFSTLFTLLLWDVIYADIPGVFNSPFQTAPLDLKSEFFYSQRKDLIEKRVSEINNGLFLDIIDSVYSRERPKGTLCLGINWERFSKSDIMEIALCIGPEKLAKVCKSMAFLYWAHMSGMPDLCIWRTDNLHFKLVEVKGEGDRASDQQKFWLNLLCDCGIDAFILNVKQSKKIII